jgi:chitinase
MLLDFNVFNSLRQEEIIRACTANSTGLGDVANADNSSMVLVGNTTTVLLGNNTTAEVGSCAPKGSLVPVKESLQLAFYESKIVATLTDLEDAAQHFATSLTQRVSDCNATTAFAYSSSISIGMFAESRTREIAKSVLPQFIAQIKSTSFSKNIVVQLYAKDDRKSKYSFSITISGDRDILFVQDAVAT